MTRNYAQHTTRQQAVARKEHFSLNWLSWLTPARASRGTIQQMLPLRGIEANCLRLAVPGKRRTYTYKAVVAVTPVNFTLMSLQEQEQVLEAFRAFLARLQAYKRISIHIKIEPYDLQPYLDRLQETTAQRPEPIIKQMAADHQAFVLSLADVRALLQRHFYLIVTADAEPRQALLGKRVLGEGWAQARGQLAQRCTEIIEDMGRIGLAARRLETTELAQYYASCVHSAAARAFPLRPAQIAAVDTPLQAAPYRTFLPTQEPAPQQETAQVQEEQHPGEAKHQRSDERAGDLVRLSELLAPTVLETHARYIRLVQHDLDEYCRSYAIIGYPAQVTPGWLDRLIQMEEPGVDIVLHLETLDAGAYIRRLTRRLAGFRATLAVDEKRGTIPDPYILAARTEVEALREKLASQTEQVFGVSLTIQLRADSRAALKARSARLLSLLHSLELTAVELVLEHHKGWQMCLPGGTDDLRRRKVLDTSSLLTAFPFCSSQLSTESGILTGVMPNGSLVILDPTSESLENGHEVKFARSGAGKSYDEKVRLSRSLLLGMECIVIDPEDEYATLARTYGGSILRLSSGALQLNPCDLPLFRQQGDRAERNILEEKFQALLTLCDLLLAEREKGVLSQKEKAYLVRVFRHVYASHGITYDPATHHHEPPCIGEIYQAIREEVCGPDTFELADRLQRHLASFPRQTQVRLDHLVVFSIRDLDAELRPVGLFLITDYVWTQVRRQRYPHPRLLVIDEAWSLLQFEAGGQFLASLARRARKYNLCLRTITQDVEDFVNSEWGRAILVNSAMKFLMKQDSTTIDAVSEAFKLSEGERRYLLACGKGEGLFFARETHVPLKVVASALEHKLATTNPQELLREAQAAQQQGIALAWQQDAQPPPLPQPAPVVSIAQSRQTSPEPGMPLTDDELENEQTERYR